MTKGKRRTGRPPKTPAKKSVRRAYLGERDGSPHAGNTALTNGEIRRTAKFRAYARMMKLAEEINQELALAVAASPPNPAVIHDLQDRLRDVLKGLLPYEKPRLTAMKVSGDKNAPLFDLSGLADKELLAMRRMLLKAKQVEEREEEEEDVGN
jgi:hypothetical protein